MTTATDALKRAAAERALAQVQDGMRLGLGSGSTSQRFITLLGERLRQGALTRVVGVATSRASEAQARRLGIPTAPLDETPLDLAVDGMDELDPTLDAIKGLGGALAREKMVAACAARLILIADESKRVAHLGEKAPIPVEVTPFGWRATTVKLERLGLRPVLRERGGKPVVTDNHNHILDCWASPPFDAAALGCAIKQLPGVLEHGLFVGMAALAYVATPAGVKELRRGAA